MPVERPGSVTAAGVLCIIYGSLFTICGLCSIVMLAVQGAAGGNLFAGGDPDFAKIQGGLEAHLERTLPAFHAVNVGGNILTLVEAALLLIAGIGLQGMRPWARTLALVGAFLAIVSTIFTVVYQTVYVIPATNTFFRDLLPPGLPPPVVEAARFGATIMPIVVVSVSVVVILYLLIIVLLLCVSRARLAFAAAARGEFAQIDDGREPERRGEPRQDEDWRYPQSPEGPQDDWRIK